MTDRPILFSGPMVRAILEARKTQTRRVLKCPAWAQVQGWPERIMDEQDLKGRLSWFSAETGCLSPLPIPQPGDRLWVRETWSDVNDHGVESVAYRADHEVAAIDECHHDTLRDNYLYATWASDLMGGVEGNWRPSIHMPRWASRLTLTVTDVRVQRLQEISGADAIDEGVKPTIGPNPKSGKDAFRELWDSLSAKRGFGWDANPWVVAVTFDPHRVNIDKMDRRPAPSPGEGE